MEKKPFAVSDLFQFERMVAPTVLKVVYWLGLVGIAIYMLIAFFGAFAVMSYDAAAGLGTIVLAIVGGLFGLLFWRILIEVYMIFFSINERVGEIRDMMKEKSDD